MWGQGTTFHPRTGIQALEERQAPDPRLRGRLGQRGRAQQQTAEPWQRSMSGRAEKEHGKAQIMKDPFFRFCVETFLEATSVLVPRSGFAPGYRRPHQAKTSQVLQTKVWYRPRVGCSQVQAGTAVLRLKARLQLSLHCLHTHGQHLNHCPFAAQLFPISSKVEDRAAGRREAAQPKMHSPCHSTPTWAEGRSPPLCWTYGLLG